MLKKMFRRQAYYYASAVFLLVLLVYTIAISHQPYIGLELKNINGQWIVTLSDPDGQGYISGIRPGDTILKIDQDDPGKNRSVQLWGEVEGVSTIGFHKPDQSIAQMIKMPRFSSLRSTLNDAPFEILGFAFWFLGFMARFKRPFLAQAQALFWLNWVIGLTFVLAPASSRSLLLAKDLELITFAVTPVFLIDFISFLQHETINRLYRFIRFILIMLSVIIIILIVWQPTGNVQFFNSLRKLVLITVSIGSLFVLLNLGILVTFAKNKPKANQANFLLLGIMIGFLPFILLTGMPLIIGFQPILNAHLSSLFISIIPMTWYYAIVKDYLPDSRRLIEAIISNFLAGLMISFVVSYLLLILKVSRTFNLSLYLSTLAVVVMFILGFNLLKLVIDRFLNSHVFSGGKETFKKRILELNQSLTSLNIDELILEELVKSLEIEGALIIVENAKGEYLKKSKGIFLERPTEQIKLEDFFRANRKIDSGAELLTVDSPAEVYISYNVNDFTCGIFLSHRYSHIKFERDELPLIMLISGQLAQRLITALIVKELSKEIEKIAQELQSNERKIQRLQRVNNFFFKNFEQEKKMLAQDLHDGPLQLALDLNRWFGSIDDEWFAAKFNKVPRAGEHIREVIRNLTFELRSICSDLRPQSLTDLGLLNAVQVLCEEKMNNDPVLINLQTVGISEAMRFNEDIELAAFRFLQEGITNAIKHSGSGEIMLKIELDNSKIVLTVSDYGKGFDTGKIDDWQLTSEHLGLVGIKERLKGLGGELQVTSAIPQGTILKATIPAREGDI